MKKILLLLLGILILSNVATAQENGTQLAKSAGKTLARYNIDPANSSAKLIEAKQKNT
jgi:hypothetical protein